MVPNGNGNGAAPMETDTNGQNKRRRLDSRVYIGSSDLGYRREHMEVSNCMSHLEFLQSMLNAIRAATNRPVIAQVEGALHNGLYQDIDVVQELWEHAFK